MEMVIKMFSDFEAQHGKPATQVTLAPLLYDSLKSELREMMPKNQVQNDVVIDFIELRGVRINRQALQ